MFRWLFGISYIKSMFPFYPPYGLAKESRCQVLRSCKRWLGVFFWQQVNKNITPKRGRRRKSTSFPTKWVFPKIGVPQNGWFMEHPIKMDDLGVPLFVEKPKWRDSRVRNKVRVGTRTKPGCRWFCFEVQTFSPLQKIPGEKNPVSLNRNVPCAVWRVFDFLCELWSKTLCFFSGIFCLGLYYLVL